MRISRQSISSSLCWPAPLHAGFSAGVARGVTGALLSMACAFGNGQAVVQQPAKAQDAPVAVQFTDIHKAAGITFVQDSTNSDEKYYLETMGSGVHGSTTTRMD